MRVLLNIELETAKGNEIIASGRMGEVMEGILGNLKPEASYFFARNGSRALTLVVDSPNGTALPSLLEPFWLQLGARVEALPCMSTEELQNGLSGLRRGFDMP